MHWQEFGLEICPNILLLQDLKGFSSQLFLLYLNTCILCCWKKLDDHSPCIFIVNFIRYIEIHEYDIKDRASSKMVSFFEPVTIQFARLIPIHSFPTSIGFFYQVKHTSTQFLNWSSKNSIQSSRRRMINMISAMAAWQETSGHGALSEFSIKGISSFVQCSLGLDFSMNCAAR